MFCACAAGSLWGNNITADILETIKDALQPEARERRRVAAALIQNQVSSAHTFCVWLCQCLQSMRICAYMSICACMSICVYKSALM